ncbi:MAG TPA: hypothetical protein VJ508_13335 [Saprospiraceae bacterium]|nr:hypothetical protein [Saprospiraceae bacterium]
MRKFLFTVLLLLAVYVAYMYFFGRGEDKSDATTIVNETKDVVKAVGNFLKLQKEKYNAGDFDRLISKAENSIHKLRSTSTGNQGEVKQTLQDLQGELNKIDPQKLTQEQRDKLQKLMKELQEDLK